MTLYEKIQSELRLQLVAEVAVLGKLRIPIGEDASLLLTQDDVGALVRSAVAIASSKGYPSLVDPMVGNN